jgi:arsenate reductase
MTITLITLYGIPNCDQVKQARIWLDAHAIAYHFHDFKKAGITQTLIEGWLHDVNWEVLLNRKGTTWRKVDDARKAATQDAASAILLMLEMPSIVKRPILAIPATGSHAGQTHVGFSAANYAQIFQERAVA